MGEVSPTASSNPETEGEVTMVDYTRDRSYTRARRLGHDEEEAGRSRK